MTLFSKFQANVQCCGLSSGWKYWKDCSGFGPKFCLDSLSQIDFCTVHLNPSQMLQAADIYEDTILLFMGDNGGIHLRKGLSWWLWFSCSWETIHGNNWVSGYMKKSLNSGRIGNKPVWKCTNCNKNRTKRKLDHLWKGGGNNFPLRGYKGYVSIYHHHHHQNHHHHHPHHRHHHNQVWEGGVRTPAFVHYPRLNNTGYQSPFPSLFDKILTSTSWHNDSRVVLENLVHVTDWLPTLLTAAGVSQEELDQEG